MTRKIRLFKHQTYNQARNGELRYEFSDPDNTDRNGDPAGGLLTLSRFARKDGSPYLRVDVHALDGDVEVVAPIKNLPEVYMLLEIDWHTRGFTVRLVSFNKQEVENELADLRDYYPSRNYVVTSYNNKDWE